MPVASYFRKNVNKKLVDTLTYYVRYIYRYTHIYIYMVYVYDSIKYNIVRVNDTSTKQYRYRPIDFF